MAIVHVTKENFKQEVLEANQPVVVDFFATWCGPCKSLSPVLEDVVAEDSFKKIVKVDIDAEPELASEYKIMSVPTLLLFKHGEVVEKSVGLIQKDKGIKLLGGNKMAIVHVTKENFKQEVLEANQPVVVDFFATWCGPCKSLSPVLEDVVAEDSFKKIVKVDIDAEPELASEYKIMSVPTLLLFKHGEVVEKSVGLIQKDEVKALFSK